MRHSLYQLILSPPPSFRSSWEVPNWWPHKSHRTRRIQYVEGWSQVNVETHGKWYRSTHYVIICMYLPATESITMSARLHPCLNILLRQIAILGQSSIYYTAMRKTEWNLAALEWNKWGICTLSFNMSFSGLFFAWAATEKPLAGPGSRKLACQLYCICAVCVYLHKLYAYIYVHLNIANFSC